MRLPTQRRGLIALNAALLAALAAVSLQPAATAQRQGNQRAAGNYTMVSGRVVGGNTSAVYILDSANQELVGLLYNGGTKTYEPIGYRDLVTDAQAVPGR